MQCKLPQRRPYSTGLTCRVLGGIGLENKAGVQGHWPAPSDGIPMQLPPCGTLQFATDLLSHRGCTNHQKLQQGAHFQSNCLSMVEKKWVVKAQPDAQILTRLARELGVSRPLAAVLAQRGVTSFDAAKAFFRPDISLLHDPFLMKGMDAAVQRIQQAIAQGEKVLVYGDYDVDGTTAVALMVQFIAEHSPRVDYYIPDRHKEGYGLSTTGIDAAAERHVSLIIALDCGIKAVEEVEYARERGIDVIVCDHHLPGEQLPHAIILNPKQEGCAYPYKELCGCGVAFKCVQAIHRSMGGKEEEVYHLLDLVMVAIAADIVPITGENRLLAHCGLSQFNRRPRVGFRALTQLNPKAGEWDIADVVFTIAPRINAAGRMASGGEAVELLLAKTEQTADATAKQISVRNGRRKVTDQKITAEALEMMQTDSALLSCTASTVVCKKGWHKGVVGIVASRLIEHVYRPTVVLTASRGIAVGSARSVKGFDIYRAIEQCGDVLEQFGGHAHAAGLTMKLEHVPAFRKKFDQIVAASISEDQLVPEIEIDGELDFQTLLEDRRGGMPRFYRVLKQMGPFGPGNRRPVFMTKKVSDAGYSVVLKGEHLKLSLVQDNRNEWVAHGIAFGMAEKYDLLQRGTVTIVYTLEENHWNGHTSLQLTVKDIRAEDAP